MKLSAFSCCTSRYELYWNEEEKLACEMKILFPRRFNFNSIMSCACRLYRENTGIHSNAQKVQFYVCYLKHDLLPTVNFFSLSMTIFIQWKTCVCKLVHVNEIEILLGWSYFAFWKFRLYLPMMSIIKID